MDWSRWPNFSESEFRCKHCGRAAMQPQFMDRLQALRDRFGHPMIVNSGYRCPEYNAQVSSTGLTGPHTTGCAVDIRVYGERAFELLRRATEGGDGAMMTGIGVSQKGATAGRFIHLDRVDAPGIPRPRVWSY